MPRRESQKPFQELSGFIRFEDHSKRHDTLSVRPVKEPNYSTNSLMVAKSSPRRRGDIVAPPVG